MIGMKVAFVDVLDSGTFVAVPRQVGSKLGYQKRLKYTDQQLNMITDTTVSEKHILPQTQYTMSKYSTPISRRSRLSNPKYFLVPLLLILTILYTQLISPALNFASYEADIHLKYEDVLAEVRSRNPSPDPLEIYKPKLSTNSYSQKILITEEMQSQTPPPESEKVNAVILMLCRNWELESVLKSMRSLEDRFNRRYKYDWVFLNDVPFTEKFKEATSLMTDSVTKYALIPSEQWDRPDWIDNETFEAGLKEMNENGVLYGDSKSYRNMCRFNSGYFFRQQILDEYDYYFRVEPDVEYFCDFQYDPFRVMRDNGKKYGFVIALHEYEETIPTLWDTVMDFLEENPDLLAKENSKAFLTDMEEIGEFQMRLDLVNEYNLCHFWSNFEIGDLNFFRSEAYLKFFTYLEKTGNFYYERWGDAPVHSLAVALLLNSTDVHYFEDLGYFHAPFANCPSSNAVRLSKRCLCDYNDENVIDIQFHSCLPRWWRVGGKTFMKIKGELQHTTQHVLTDLFFGLARGHIGSSQTWNQRLGFIDVVQGQRPQLGDFKRMQLLQAFVTSGSLQQLLHSDLINSSLSSSLPSLSSSSVLLSVSMCSPFSKSTKDPSSLMTLFLSLKAARIRILASLRFKAINSIFSPV
ncbi:hypothetical protein WICPIJ_009208 [Wickerhamomyces pijperi]|uniref:Glycosyltransferase family 15 protein n=1 Tax=Wickerhamomyces pijperi TaxID=599730 RepID=A0A9P8TDV8_WICPI|nr:hypothetical protein WICPIJ_009208 [Wickerhamomyces pijperi]